MSAISTPSCNGSECAAALAKLIALEKPLRTFRSFSSVAPGVGYANLNLAGSPVGDASRLAGRDRGVRQSGRQGFYLSPQEDRSLHLAARYSIRNGLMGDVIEIEALARKVGGVEQLRKAMQEAIDSVRQAQPPDTEPDDGGASHGSRTPKRHLFALVLAEPDDDYAKSKIYPREKFFNAESGEDLDIIFPGFTSTSLESFDADLFHDVVQWLRNRFDDFHYHGVTTVVIFASNSREKSHLEPMDDSAVLFFELEPMQAEKFIAGPEEFFQRLFEFAHKHPGDDALWEFRNDIKESKIIEAVTTSFLDSAAQGVVASLAFPLTVLRRFFGIAKHTKIHRGTGEGKDPTK